MDSDFAWKMFRARCNVKNEGSTGFHDWSRHMQEPKFEKQKTNNHKQFSVDYPKFSLWVLFWVILCVRCVISWAAGSMNALKHTEQVYIWLWAWIDDVLDNAQEKIANADTLIWTCLLGLFTHPYFVLLSLFLLPYTGSTWIERSWRPSGPPWSCCKYSVSMVSRHSLQKSSFSQKRHSIFRSLRGLREWSERSKAQKHH